MMMPECIGVDCNNEATEQIRAGGGKEYCEDCFHNMKETSYNRRHVKNGPHQQGRGKFHGTNYAPNWSKNRVT